MDPYYEQRLRDEVFYLHSLWHQGPPRRNPNPNPNHNTSTKRLPPSNPPEFKKKKTNDKKPRGRKGKRGKKTTPQSDPPPVSDVEWPCQEIEANPSSSTSDWPTPNPAPPSVSAEERVLFAAAQIHKKAVTAVEEFFAGNLDSDGEENSGSDEDDLMDEDGYEEYQFFLKLFKEDEELRGYYEKNCEGGDFCCLVCGGIGKRRKFKHCVALLLHSATTVKTTKKKAHRAYAQVVCRVLGWDIDRLPTIDLSLGDPLERWLAKSIESQGNAEVAIRELSMINKDSALENGNNGEIIQKQVSDADQEEDLPSSCAPGTSNVIGDILMPCENFLKDGDANKSSENLDNKDNSESPLCTNKEVITNAATNVMESSSRVQSLGNGNTEGVVTCLNSLKDGDATNKSSENLDNKDNSESPLRMNKEVVTNAVMNVMESSIGDQGLSDGNTEGVVTCPDHSKHNGVGIKVEETRRGGIVVVSDLKESNGNPS